MDATQKYTEVKEFEFEIEEDLLYKLSDWGFLQYSIPAEVFYNMDKIPEKNAFSQKFAGVAPDDDGNPVYFEAIILRQEEEAPVLVDLTLIDTDEYLDYILKNKSLSHCLPKNN
tara:strand:- start:1042 stop:1383 length:342 start_codon:yes stop_codon:yes gene_type:complete